MDYVDFKGKEKKRKKVMRKHKYLIFFCFYHYFQMILMDRKNFFLLKILLIIIKIGFFGNHFIVYLYRMAIVRNIKQNILAIYSAYMM